MPNATEDDNQWQGLWTSCNALVRRIERLLVSIIEWMIPRASSHPALPGYPPTNPRHDEFTIIPEDSPFLALFEHEFGDSHPLFHACRFAEALKIARDKSKLVFMYLHSTDNPFADSFCKETLCSQLVVEFLDANFVSWGEVASRGEGLEMATALQVNAFPFCAVVAPDSGEDIAVLQKLEGPATPEELVKILQKTMHEQGLAFSRLREEAEEDARKADRQLRQEQDAAFLEALQKDKEKERAKALSEENVHLAAERRLKERKEKFRRHPTLKSPISKQKEASKENITSKTEQPITKIKIRFPDGSTKERKFPITETIRSIYKYIDSQDLPGIGSYHLVSFPRRIYGYEQLDMTLKDAGLCQSAALFLEQLQ